MNRPLHYYLVGQTPVPCDDLIEWAKHFDVDEHTVRLTRVGRHFVSTVFLGLDHRWGDGPPLLFETMIYTKVVAKNPWDRRAWLDYQRRCSTWIEAEKQHEAAVEHVRKTGDDVEQLYPEARI
jgi:hypothetical protein